jgi:hypothetical protein
LSCGGIGRVFRLSFSALLPWVNPLGDALGVPRLGRHRTCKALPSLSEKDRDQHDPFPAHDRADRDRDDKVFGYLSAGHPGLRWTCAGGNGLEPAEPSFPESSVRHFRRHRIDTNLQVLLRNRERRKVQADFLVLRNQTRARLVAPEPRAGFRLESHYPDLSGSPCRAGLTRH